MYESIQETVIRLWEAFVQWLKSDEFIALSEVGMQRALKLVLAL